ncbi:MAG: hypothetical protein KatS3mg110_0926 [Pirellulaceae bacterium]|nr:MAG: hypothetical protein KatS3mg110_0926 [Pirellulaceae bacterium]
MRERNVSGGCKEKRDRELANDRPGGFDASTASERRLAPRSGVLLASMIWLVALGASSWLRADSPPAKLEYNRHVRPILAENCFPCHGPDSAARKADLRLDQRDAAIEMGAIVPGRPSESELVRRILSDDPDYRMPPSVTKKTLTDEQKTLLQKWIAQGAEYQPHWSLIPPFRPELPQVKQSDWVRNPIDAFILARLEAEGLQPAPEADRYTLVRRVSLDLTGLPPDPELVEAFVNDPSPRAYENLVDRLLKSPAWGEHRARYWLDYARYADTHGIHFDNYREIWAYRDWLISAFNRNMPFDQFTIENLAGDLLPNPTLDQLIASGFNRCNITTNEGGVIPEEYLVLYTRDRTETTAQVWLGLTAGCAVCHSHKFDPLTQREFYEMAAFFNNTTQGAMDGNIKDTPPVVVVPMDEDRQRWDELAGEIPRVQAELAERKGQARQPFDEWLATAKPEQVLERVPRDKLYLHAGFNEGNGQMAQVAIEGKLVPVALSESARWQAGPTGDGALELQGAACVLPEVGDFEGDEPFSVAAWIKLQANDSSGALCARMDDTQAYRGWDFWVQRRQVGMHIIHRWPENAIKVVTKKQIPANRWTHVAISYDGSRKAAGIKIYVNGEPQEVNVEADRLSETIRTEVPFKVGQRHSGQGLSAAGLQDLRIYRRAIGTADASGLAKMTRFAAIVSKPADQRKESEVEELFDWWVATFDEPFRQIQQRLASLEREKAAIRSRATVAHVMQEKPTPPEAYVLFRGEYDKRRERVEPDTPDMLPPMPPDLPRNRLGFAKWLLLPEHPLTARVTVNRFWQEVFGTGLVRTSGDFGVAGELPSHPELLDWLAVEFRESGWNIQHMYRLMVTSATYRQAAVVTPEKLQKDPENRLLSRGPRFRMDAEMVRDYALAASGLLSRRIGGPSVKPYQPPGVWEAVAMIGSNTRDYRRDSGESLYRRSMYTFWKRSAPPASMEIFNAPSREVCTVRRERTNTPLQALVTLNDEQFVEAARFLAQRALKAETTTDGRIRFITRRVLIRPLRDEEGAVLQQTLDQLLAYYREHPEDAGKLIRVGESPPDASVDPSELAGWTMLVNTVLNLDEVLNK